LGAPPGQNRSNRRRRSRPANIGGVYKSLTTALLARTQVASSVFRPAASVARSSSIPVRAIDLKPMRQRQWSAYFTPLPGEGGLPSAAAFDQVRAAGARGLRTPSSFATPAGVFRAAGDEHPNCAGTISSARSCPRRSGATRPGSRCSTVFRYRRRSRPVANAPAIEPRLVRRFSALAARLSPGTDVICFAAIARRPFASTVSRPRSIDLRWPAVAALRPKTVRCNS